MTIAGIISENTTVQSILSEYESLLKEADRLFQDYVRTHSLEITCGPACSDCCYEVYVNFIEACYLQIGMQSLAPRIRHTIRLRAIKNIPKMERLEKIAWTIDKRSNGVVQDAKVLLGYLLRKKIRCPFAEEQAGCLVYRYRPPVIGRLFGIPLKTRKDQEIPLACGRNTPTLLEPPPTGLSVLPPLNARKFQKKVVELSRALELILTGQKHPSWPIWFVALFPLEKFVKRDNVEEKWSNPEEQRPKACFGQSGSVRQRLQKLGVYSTPAITTLLATGESYCQTKA